MQQGASIKINIKTGEFEISGSEDFVKENLKLLDKFIKPSSSSESTTPSSPAVRKLPSTKPSLLSTKGSFKTYIAKLPSTTRQGDYLLASAYFIAQNNDDRTFGTREASTLLKSVQLEITNPSQYIKNNLNSGRLKQISQRRFSFTEKGLQHISRFISK